MPLQASENDIFWFESADGSRINTIMNLYIQHKTFTAETLMSALYIQRVTLNEKLLNSSSYQILHHTVCTVL